MPTNRTPIGRPPINRITPQVVEAWTACDYHALHRALGLKPWHSSVLPREVTPLGVDQDDDTDDKDDRKLIELQRQLLEIAGWPDARSAYEENLAEAISWADYCREQVEHPNPGHQGTGCDPVSRREALEEAEARVAYRRELLAGLDAVRKKWAPASGPTSLESPGRRH